MRKITILLFALYFGVGLHGQSATDDKPAPEKPADFAIADLAANYSGGGYECTVKYSDGKVFSLIKTLAITSKDGQMIDQDNFDEQVFKILEYFNKMGFDFVSVNPGNLIDNRIRIVRDVYDCKRFYFKRKGL